MDSWNDSENTELTGEITEGYFSEGSGNVRDAPKKKHPKKKGRIQDPGINDSPAFTEDDSRIFTPDSRKSFVESRNSEGVGADESSVQESFSESKPKRGYSKNSAYKKKEYHKRLKAKAKEKRENQRKRIAEEARKNAESVNQSENLGLSESYDATDISGGETEADHLIQENDESLCSGFGNWEADSQQPEFGVVNTCKSGENGTYDIHRSRSNDRKTVSGNAEKETIAGYEGNGIFYADSEVEDKNHSDFQTHNNPNRKTESQKLVPNTGSNCADSTMKTNPGKSHDTRGKPDIPESSGKKTTLTLFGSDDKDSIRNSSHGTSRRVVGKLSGTGVKATEYSVRKAGSAISKATGEKDDNAGADAMRLAEQGGETVSRYGFYVAKDVKDKAFEESTKTVKQVSDYTTGSIFDTAKKELTKEEKKKQAYKKALRKKRRKAYQKAKKAAKETGKKTYEGTKETAKAIKAVVRLVARTVFAIPRAILIIILLIIVLLLIGGEIAGSTVSLVTEAASIMSAATYQSSPQMIDQADLEFSYMELMLRDRIDEIEDDYPDYDEYSYTLGSIGHDPFTLINYLHAEYGTINSDAMAGLNDLFNAMYELKLTPTEETRYRLVPKPPEEDDEDDDSDDEDEESEDDEEDSDEEDDGDDSDDDEEDEDEEPEYILEEYTVSILKVELNSRSLESVVDERLAGNATGKAIYAVLNKTHGLVQYIASPTFDTWYVESYYGYRRNPYGDYPELHRGLDIAMPIGTSVHSAISGTVKEIGSDPMFGDYIVVEDERGYTVKYASMGRISAIQDSIVHQGETLGYSGSNGSEPPSLHMEFQVNGTYYNPLFYTANIPPETD